MTRLRFGKCLLNDTLGLMNRHDSGLCDTCFVKEDVKHFLMDCVDYVPIQEILVQSLLDANSRMSVESLLGNSVHFDAVIDFVKKSKRAL